MKTIKIIDLLNKITNDEKIPERIKYNDYEYRYHDKKHGYCRSGYDCTYINLSTDYCLFYILNDEVEILEDEKEMPENNFNYIYSCEDERIMVNFENIKTTLKDIIDYLKSKGE